MMRIYLFLTVLVVLSTFLSTYSCFNLDLKKRRILKGPRDSYFGFSIALLEPKRSTSILVGAPLSNDTTMPNVDQPGAIYKCDIPIDLGASAVCQSMNIDNSTGDDKNPVSNAYYKHGKHGQWLGVSLVAPVGRSGAGIVACGHRWYNQRHPAEWYMNGICYEIPTDLVSPSTKLIPLVVGSTYQVEKFNDNVIYTYGMATMGMSVHYSAGNLLIGAPGLTRWTGGFIYIRGDQTHIMKSDTKRSKQTQDRYLGYAVSSGSYFANLNYFAIGEPRYELTGRVVLFWSEQASFQLENRDMEITSDDVAKVIDEPLPMNSYFGASLCTTDVNNDGFDDLLIGAPFYSQTTSPGSVQVTGDEGRVFLLFGSDSLTTGFRISQKPLAGSNTYRARFGTTMASLGDINKDGYNDVAIGAPYEEDTGAVYVYNGYPGGLWTAFSQRILGIDVDPAFSGFGISLSGNIDINKDGINDVGVGSYTADSAVLLYGQPVLQMQVDLSAPDSIEKDKRNFDIEVFFRYDYRRCSEITMGVSVRLDDQYSDTPRLMFVDSGQPDNKTSIEFISWKKQIYPVFVKSTRDLLSPIHVTVEYNLEDIVCEASAISPTISRFSGDLAKDPLLLKEKMIYFKTECPNNVCHTDLKLEASAEYENINEAFIKGTDSLAMVVKVTADGDPAYGTEMLFTYPKLMNYQHVDKLDGETSVSCIPQDALQDQGNEVTSFVVTKVVDENRFLGLVCLIGNPLPNDTSVTFRLQFQVPPAPTELVFGLNVTTVSTETNTDDNTKQLQIEVKNYVTTDLFGISSPDYLLMRDYLDLLETVHVYELGNLGPSPLPGARFDVYFPQVQSGNQAQLFLNTTELSCKRPCEMQCSFRNQGGSIPIVYTWYRDGWTAHKSSDHGAPLTDIAKLDCQSSSCAVLGCRVTDLSPKESAVLTLTFKIHPSVLSVATSGKAAKIFSTSVTILEEDSIVTEITKQKVLLFTELVPPTIPTKAVDWWIPLASVVFGIALVALLIVILWKIGFFKRNTRDELERRRMVETDKRSSKTEKDNLSENEKSKEPRNNTDAETKGKMNGEMEEIEI